MLDDNLDVDDEDPTSRGSPVHSDAGSDSGRSRSGRRSYEVAMVTEISPEFSLISVLSKNIWLLRTLSKYKLSMNF